MDIPFYRKYLRQIVQEAIENSDGSVSGISEYLHSIQLRRFLVRNRKEKETALREARKAFDEHRHWPVDIIVSHIGLDPKELGLRE